MKELFLGIPKDISSHVNKIDLSTSSVDCNIQIEELLQKTVLLGGKRLRPLLTHLFGKLWGFSIDEIDIIGKSIEKVHAASLAHDDVVDFATIRRGRPSINVISSNKMAVLAGDYLLADVIVDLTHLNSVYLIKEMSLVIKKLTDGEWLQLDLSKSREYTFDKIIEIATLKTSSVMSWCSVSPAILANANEEIIELSRHFGYHLGIAFQLIDDTIDFGHNFEKDIMADINNNIVNSVGAIVLDLSQEKELRFKSGESLSTVFENVNFSSAISQIKEIAREHLIESKNILHQIVEIGALDSKSKAYKSIINIIDYLENRKH